MQHSWILFILCNFLFVSSIAGLNFCYICQGTNATTGQFCNLDRTCMGNSCVLALNAGGSWVSNCVENSTNVPTTLAPGTCSLSGTNIYCSCSSDFCNNPKNLTDKIKAVSATALINLPPASADTLTCFECGTVYGDNVGNGNSSLNITCDGARTCQGTACLTRRSKKPRSYCADSWMGNLEVGCTKMNGVDELCVCKQSMCNYPYNPMLGVDTTTPATTVATTRASTLQSSTGWASSSTVRTTTISMPTTVTLPDGTIVCPDGKQYGPNEQAVFMGEKLKASILSNFGKFADKEAVKNFESGINYHICNYKD
jgi:hypothetical protein